MPNPVFDGPNGSIFSLLMETCYENVLLQKVLITDVLCNRLNIHYK